MRSVMKMKLLAAATAFAAVVAFSYAGTTPASAEYCYGYCHKKSPSPPKSSSTGKIVVGCIMGSAAGLILASIVKGGGLKWYTQKEWEDLKVKVPNPLTTEEAWFIAGTCGLGAFLIRPAKS